MKKLLITFSTLSIFPTLGQLSIACEASEQKELLQILNSIKSVNITDVDEIQLKEWCVEWIKNIEKETQPHMLNNDKLKQIILINLAILAVARFIDEEERFKTTIQQLNTKNNANLDAVFKTLQEISEEKIVKALMLVFLISDIDNKKSAFDCKFEEKTLNQTNKQFTLTVEKANWNDISKETNQAFIKTKKSIVDTPINDMLSKLDIPSNLKNKALKIQALIKHVNFKDVKKVYDSITNAKKTFTIDFTAK